MDQLGGRKFLLTVIGILLAVVVPVVYSKLQISEAITQLVIGMIAAGIGTYGFTNVLADKYYKPEIKDDRGVEVEKQ
jgi:hypothetical protein